MTFADLLYGEFSYRKLLICTLLMEKKYFIIIYYISCALEILVIQKAVVCERFIFFLEIK